jgi:hypothetical protein
MIMDSKQLIVGKLYYPIYGIEYLTGTASDLRAQYTSTSLHVLPMMFLGFTDEFADFKNLKKFRLKFLVGNELWIVEDPDNSIDYCFEEVDDGGGI